MKLSKLKVSLVSSALTVAALAYIGWDLAKLQSGLEPAPNSAIVAAEKTEFSPPIPISSYDSFDVTVVDDLFVRVHTRETEKAMGNILLVHGAGGGAWVWEEFFEDLPETYNLYALSWRGHFESSPVSDADSADYVEDQLAVLTAIATRNDLPTHVVGHSYGGATSVLMAAREEIKVASLHLLAPVVPLDYSLTQAVFTPLIAPVFIGTKNEADGVFGGMFLSEARMQHWFEAYANFPFSDEKPSLIAGDGISPAWQDELYSAYQRINERAIPTWLTIAQYDNVVIPQRQASIGQLAGADITTMPAGHYLQLDSENATVMNDLLRRLDAITNAGRAVSQNGS